MHKPEIRPLVYARLFPNPKPTDPTTFHAHVLRNLVPEARLETVRFYGPIDCLEAQYPGLDYSNLGHRVRLGCFQWHRRLFRAFQELRLTDAEIRQLCNWEGTLSAREEYERIHKVKIKDTTWDGIEPFVSGSSIAVMAPRVAENQVEEMNEFEDNGDGEYENMEESEDEDIGFAEEEEQASEDEFQPSVGLDLNQRLIAATEARARGEEVVLDAAWEQWLKEAAERNGYPQFPPITWPGVAQQPSVGLAHWNQMMPETYRSIPGHIPPFNNGGNISIPHTARSETSLLTPMRPPTPLSAEAP